MRRNTEDEMLPIRMPLVVQAENRDNSTSKDAKLVNCIVEPSSNANDYIVIKRPGYGINADNISIGGTGNIGGIGRGLYNWKHAVYIGPIITFTEVTIGVFGGNVVNLGTGGVIGIVGFSPDTVYNFLPIPAIPTPILMIGTNYWTDGAGIFGVVDVNFPVNPVGRPAFLNTIIYVLDAAGTIWGSQNANDPVTWNALKFITASEGGRGITLAQQLNYIVALMAEYLEVFYDAGNATGSPLGIVQGAKLRVGCVDARTVQAINDVLIWVSNNYEGGHKIVILENLRIRVISSPYVERLLRGIYIGKTGATAPNYTSFSLTVSGHRLYFLTINDTNAGNSIDPAVNITLVYDLEASLWYQWKGTTEAIWPIVAGVHTSYGDIVQHITNGFAYTFDESFYADNLVLFDVDIVTPNFSRETDKKKHLSLMRVNANQTPGSLLQVRYSDDDYQNWSNFRTFDLSQPRPFLSGWGTFYRRAHHFRYHTNTPLRLTSVDLQIDLGTL